MLIPVNALQDISTSDISKLCGDDRLPDDLHAPPSQSEGFPCRQPCVPFHHVAGMRYYVHGGESYVLTKY